MRLAAIMDHVHRARVTANIRLLKTSQSLTKLFMNEEQFKLPDGRVTHDIEVYASAWTAIGDILESKYELEIIGFDPYILVKNKGERMISSVALPMWFVKQLIK